MRDKDRKLNDRAIKAIAELSSNLEGKEFIDPRDFTSLTKEYEQLDNDIHRKTGNLLSTVGFINKHLTIILNVLPNTTRILPVLNLWRLESALTQSRVTILMNNSLLPSPTMLGLDL